MLKSYSVQQINSISKKKAIWCYGCGKRFHEIIAQYKGEPFLTRIEALIDGNRDLWGMQKEIAGRIIPVSSPETMRTADGKKILILITSDKDAEIYECNKALLSDLQIDCSVYPRFYYTYAKAFLFIASLFPLRRQILYRAGEEPHENAEVIVKYLKSGYAGKPYRLIALSDSSSRGVKDNAENINKDTLRRQSSLKENIRYCMKYATSKFLLYENEALQKVRTGQKLIYLNHGMIPLKQVKDVLKQPDELDYAVCPSTGCAEIYEEQYGIAKEKQVYMMPPRVERLFQNNLILHKMLDCGKRQIVIWLPTFRTLKNTDRKDSAVTSPLEIFGTDDVLEKLNDCLSRNQQLLVIKLHPRDKESINISGKHKNIVLITEKDLEAAGASLQDILGETAAMITDYSGIAFEYMLLNRPIGYVIADMDVYTRGFAVENPLAYMPGSKIKNEFDFMEFLNSLLLDEDIFRQKRNELAERLFGNMNPCAGAEMFIKFLDDRL